MKNSALATAAAFFASIVAASAMPANPMLKGTTDSGLIHVKAKKTMKGMHHMAGKDMKGMHRNMKGGKKMKGMEGMKGMKGMKGM